jgi:WD40 repeat protein
MGIVRSITREAHTAPITSCALTSPTTCHAKDLELLLATSGKDNLVKVWQLNKRGEDAGCFLECVYALTGHYDAISALAFDASGVFLLSASDDTLAHCWRVRPAPPDAPAQPTVVNIDRFAISIVWNVPLANGSALLKYIVRTEQLSSLASDGSDKKPGQDHDVDIKYKTATVDSLQPGIQYRLCVAAVNSVGQSQWSEFTDVVETLAFAPSQVDKAILYRDITATSVRLSWKAPCANGAPITSYTVKSLPENTLFAPTMETPISVSDLSLVIPGPEAARRRHGGKLKVKSAAVAKRTELDPIVYEYVLGGLWPGEVYQFIVAAENRCGLGGFSPFSDYIKMESTAPDAPAKPQLMSVDKRHAEVVWVKPRSNGSEILQYIIEWTQETELSQAAENDAQHPTSRASVTMLTKSIVGTTYKIAGLRPGRRLRVWIAATNLVNGKLTASPFSEPSDAVCTLCDVPDPPKKPRIESPTPHSIVIAVDPPCDNGASIELYQITLFTEELKFGIATKRIVREVTLVPDEFGATQQSDRWLRFIASKLRAKTFYSATVVARNAVGWSQVSASSVAVSTRPPIVPATIPMAPQIRDVEPTQAKILWSTPSHDGGAALASMVLQYRINNGEFEHEIVLFQGSELVLEHLKPRTTYTFRVAATNAVGRADFSPACEPFTTPSLVDFTIATYFASRPEIEHMKATVLQVLYCLFCKGCRKDGDQR